MAYDATELWSQKDTTQEQNGWGATRYFSVVATVAELLDERGVVNAVGIPGINESHPQWRDLRVVNKSAGPGLAERIVSVRYQWLPNGGNPDSNNDDPLTWLPEITWGISQRSEQIDQDIYGNPLANSAGDVFDSLPSVTRFGLTLRIARYEQFYDVLKARAFFNKVNSSNVVAGGITFLPRTMLCTGIAPAQTFKVGQTPIQVAYDFEIRPTINTGQPAAIAAKPFGWWVADLGTRVYKSAGALDLLFDATNKTQSVDRAIPLNSTGNALDPSKYVVYTAATTTAAPSANKSLPGQVTPVKVGNVYYLGFDVCEEANFAGLGL